MGKKCEGRNGVPLKVRIGFHAKGKKEPTGIPRALKQKGKKRGVLVKGGLVRRTRTVGSASISLSM